MTGAPILSAFSITFTIFCAYVSESEPPSTVKSWEKTKVRRPLIMPWPVTTPSPGWCCASMPNSVQRCALSMSYSRKDPSSSSSERRSRAVSLPFLCWAAMRASPPPVSAWARSPSSFLRNACFTCAGCSGSAAAANARARHGADDEVAAAPRGRSTDAEKRASMGHKIARTAS
jgi:hypothetical protein